MALEPKHSNASSVLIVTEAYNLAEGQSETAFLRAVSEIELLAASHPNVRIAVVDPTVEGIASPLLSKTFPDIEVWHLPSQTYDGQKNFIGRSAQSELIVFLDGDCRPFQTSWLKAIVSPFADPFVSAVGGLTLYDDFSLTGIAMSVIDWGYLFGPAGHSLGCYASNNVAFRREALLETPIPHDAEMRCLCYKHSQLLERKSKPVILQPSALVLHELPDVEKERLRRGYDHVAALWADPQLEETSWLWDPKSAGPRLLFRNWDLALERLRKAPSLLNVSRIGYKNVADEISRLMKLDVLGIAKAIEFGESNGLNAKAFASNQVLCVQ